jgi:hypothetical protein
MLANGLGQICGNFSGYVLGLLTIAAQPPHVSATPSRPAGRPRPAWLFPTLPTPAFPAPGHPAPRRTLIPRIKTMAKGQKKSNKEIRKPKADKSKAKGGSPTLKDDSMLGVEKKKR